MGFRRLATQVARNHVDVALIAYLDTCQVEAGDGREFTAYGLDVRLVYRELRDGKGIGTNAPGLAIDQVVLMAVKELSRGCGIGQNFQWVRAFPLTATHGDKHHRDDNGKKE